MSTQTSIGDGYVSGRDVTGAPNVDWATERESTDAFDALIDATGMFWRYNEARGQYLVHLPGKDAAAPRIDRVLVPRPELVRVGWALGPVGVECKRSREKLGRPVAQIIDYSRAVFRIGDSEAWLHLPWIFLWPFSGTGGAIESVMVQHRIGGASPTWSGDGVTFNLGHRPIAQFRGGLATVTPPTSGRKVGSR